MTRYLGEDIRQAIPCKHDAVFGEASCQEAGSQTQPTRNDVALHLRMVSYLNCTTGKVSHSVKDHTWSARPAAIAGVRCCHPPAVWRTRRVRTGQQKLYEYIVK